MHAAGHAAGRLRLCFSSAHAATGDLTRACRLPACELSSAALRALALQGRAWADLAPQLLPLLAHLRLRRSEGSPEDIAAVLGALAQLGAPWDSAVRGAATQLLAALRSRQRSTPRAALAEALWALAALGARAGVEDAAGELVEALRGLTGGDNDDRDNSAAADGDRSAGGPVAGKRARSESSDGSAAVAARAGSSTPAQAAAAAAGAGAPVSPLFACPGGGLAPRHLAWTVWAAGQIGAGELGGAHLAQLLSSLQERVSDMTADDLAAALVGASRMPHANCEPVVKRAALALTDAFERAKLTAAPEAAVEALYALGQLGVRPR